MKTVIRNSYTPQIGDYCDTIVVDRESWIKYIFDCDGVFTEWSRGKTITSLEDYREKYKDTDVFSTGVVKEKFDSIDAIDEDLQTQIDDIKAASDVVDIVGTYADLQNYDTSKLNDNDIIKVLDDETHDNDVTYYRWSTGTQSFTYIGSVTFDTQLSFTSTNPLENQAVTRAIYADGIEGQSISRGIDINNKNLGGPWYTNIGTYTDSTDAPRYDQSVAIGFSSKAANYNSTAVGFRNTASGVYSNAIGFTNTASGTDSNAIGFNNTASGNDSAALGFRNTASGEMASAIGVSNTASGEYSLATGEGASAEGASAIAIGHFPVARNTDDIVIGTSASTQAGYTNSVVIGKSAQSKGNNNVVVGPNSSATSVSGSANNTVAIGSSVYPGKDYMVSIGSGIYGGETGGVAIGANTAARGTDSVALGKGSIASAANTVSVGDGSAQTPLYRRITNVDDAVDAHDAITKSQLDTATAVMAGATSSTAGAKGLVPAPVAGDQGKFLKGDGTWGEIQIPQVRTTLYLTDNIPNLPSSFNIYKDELCSDPITWAELYDLLDSNTGMDVIIRVVSAVDSVFNIVSYEHRTDQFGVIDASNEYGAPAAYYFHADYNDMSTRSKFVVETQSFGGGLTELSYGNSTWNDFITAYQAGKIVYCRASSNSNPATGSQGRKAFMAYVNNATTPTEVEFQYVRSVSTKTSSQPVDQVYVYKLTSSGVWTVETRDMGPKIAQGTNTTVSYANGTYTVSATDTTYSAFTGATSGADGAAGLVPKPLIADKDKYLKGDGTWATVQSGQDALIIREWS